MSIQLFNHSPDLQRLRDEGYEIEIIGAFVVMNNVPSVNSSRKVTRSRLVCELDLAGDRTRKPSTHVMKYAGEYPCNQYGQPLEKIRHGSAKQALAKGLTVDHSFSSKPGPEGYANYYDKFTAYARLISHEAQAVDETITAQTFMPVDTKDDQTVFNYLETASSRAGISSITRKFEGLKIGIIGLGGTGAHILDSVAKTPVGEIHLYDGDKFLTHNAFRAPGAPSLAQLRQNFSKVAYFRRMYSKMHKNVVAHKVFVTERNISKLRDLDFVFICVDKIPPRKLITERLLKYGIPYMDVGMGLQITDNSIGGLLRTCLVTPQKSDHRTKYIPLEEPEVVDEIYASNIQVDDLNKLNATLAVLRWKKFCGFYQDNENEHFSLFAIGTNKIVNEE